MGFSEDFAQHLKADPAIIALVGDRLQPAPRKEKDPVPGVAYLVTETPVRSLDGETSGLDREDVEVACYAKTETEARQIYRAVRTRLRTEAATFRAGVTGAQHLFVEDTRLHYWRMDVVAWYGA